MRRKLCPFAPSPADCPTAPAPPQHLPAGCVPGDRLCWCDRRERRRSDMATCPHSSQWPLCATFNCFCAVGGEPGCPGSAAPAGASSSLLLLAPTESPGTVPSARDHLRGPREKPPGLGCLGTAGRGASEPFQVQESIYSPLHPPCPRVCSHPAPG